jgi:hypothetical protein
VDRIREWWDGTVIEAMSDASGARNDFGHDAERVAEALGRMPGEVAQAALDLAAEIRHWLAADEVQQKGEHEDVARRIVFGLVPPAAHLSSAEAKAHFAMLFGVTLVVQQFNILVSAQQAMVAEGIHESPIEGGGISKDLARAVPETIVGALAGVRLSFEDAGDGHASLRLQYLAFRAAPRMLLYRWHELFRAEGVEPGPNVLLASATSHMAESPSYHVPIGPDIVLRRRGVEQGWRDSVWRFSPVRNPQDPGRMLRYSGTPLAQRPKILRHMVDHFYSGGEPLVTALREDFDPGRRVAFVVNSYEQVAQFKVHLRARYPALAERTIGVTNHIPAGASGDWIVASQVETLGGREDWDAIVFPMRALARGVNIVFPQGPRANDATVGTIVFLIRPHPSADSLGFVNGIVGRASMSFDRTAFPPGASLETLRRAWSDARLEALADVRRLLRYPVVASRLGPFATSFTADVMIDVLQTIGRAMRNGIKARALFVDAAWAPRSAEGGVDDERSSMLVAMRDILRARLGDPDPVAAEVYQALYEPFLVPLERCGNLHAGP